MESTVSIGNIPYYPLKHTQSLPVEVYIRFSNKSVLFESTKFEDRRLNRPGSEELKSSLEKSTSIVRNHLGCSTLTKPIFRYAHLVPKGSESIPRKTLGHSICNIIGCTYLLEADFP